MKEKLEKLLLNVNPNIFNFTEGFKGNDFKELLFECKLLENKNLIELYEYNFGIELIPAYNNSCQLFYFGNLIGFSTSFSLYCMYSVIPSLKKLNNKKLPIIHSHTRDYISIDLDENSKTKNQLLLYAPAITLSNKFIPIYDSLETWLDTIIKCYEENIYTFDESKNLIINDNLEREISKSLNPKSFYWHKDLPY